MNEYHIYFNTEDKDNFFRYLKNLVKSFKSDINIYVSEEAMGKMKSVTWKKKFFENSEIEKVTFEIILLNNKTTMMDLIVNKKTRQVVEIGYGPINHKRTAYHPYKQKEASRKFYIV